MEVREAKNGDEIHRGLALLAPADYQMRVVRSGTRRSQQGCVGNGHRRRRGPAHLRARSRDEPAQ